MSALAWPGLPEPRGGARQWERQHRGPRRWPLHAGLTLAPRLPNETARFYILPNEYGIQLFLTPLGPLTYLGI